MSEEKNEIELSETVEQEKNNGIINAGMLTEKHLEIAEKQIELRAKFLKLALKSVRPHDFQDFGGRPYLEGEGAARIMSVIRGFKVGEPRFAIELMHPHYFIECFIPIEFMGASTVALGDCSTADVFFTGKDGNGGRYKKFIDQTTSEIMAARLLLGDAKKKARENAISRGVTELLGLKGLTWDDLQSLGFSRRDAGVSIDFKKGAQGGDIKTLTMIDALMLQAGSAFNIKGTLKDAKVRTVKRKDGNQVPVTDYFILEGTKEMKICAWGDCVEGLKIGDTVYFEKVTVSEYQGALQYMASSVEKIEV